MNLDKIKEVLADLAVNYRSTITSGYKQVELDYDNFRLMFREYGPFFACFGFHTKHKGLFGTKTKYHDFEVNVYFYLEDYPALTTFLNEVLEGRNQEVANQEEARLGKVLDQLIALKETAKKK